VEKSREPWKILVLPEVDEWIETLDEKRQRRVLDVIQYLAEEGPHLGRPYVDTLNGSKIANLKELRPGTMRIIFAFDPWRMSVLLVGGDKAGNWQQWYKDAIPLAEQRFKQYMERRRAEEQQQ
jgi:hypothetical protein